MTTDESQFAKLLIPVKKVIFLKGSFRWPARPILAGSQTADILPLKQLSRDLAKRNFKVSVTKNVFAPAAVKINRDEKIENDEAYRLIITRDGIEIFAKADAGAYYGLQTLRDLVSIYGKTLPACEIEDRPDFRRRGVYHDCSRGKVPKLDTLKQLVERLDTGKSMNYRSTWKTFSRLSSIPILARVLVLLRQWKFSPCRIIAVCTIYD